MATSFTSLNILLISSGQACCCHWWWGTSLPHPSLGHLSPKHLTGNISFVKQSKEYLPHSNGLTWMVMVFWLSGCELTCNLHYVCKPHISPLSLSHLISLVSMMINTCSPGSGVTWPLLVCIVLVRSSIPPPFRLHLGSDYNYKTRIAL